MFGRLRQSSEGYVLITALIAMGVLAILAATAFSLATMALRESARAVRTEQALYVANAGLEEALSRVRAQQEVAAGDRWSGRISLDPETEGRYTVTIQADTDAAHVRVRSEGTVRDESQVLTARLALPIVIEPPPGPSDDPPVIYQQALAGRLLITAGPGALVCGDVVTGGTATFGPNATISGGRAGLCENVTGSGSIFAARAVMGPNAEVDGEICDGPCQGRPELVSAPPASLQRQRLKELATHWYVRTRQQCSDAPAGVICRPISSGILTLTSAGQFGSPALVYVDGSVIVPKGTLTVNGRLTVVATGNITFENHARVTGGDELFCPVAFVGLGAVTTGPQAEIHASVAASIFTAGAHNTIYGNVFADHAIVGPYFKLVPQPYREDLVPPGLLRADGTYTGEQGGGEPPPDGEDQEPAIILPDGFGSWSQ